MLRASGHTTLLQERAERAEKNLNEVRTATIRTRPPPSASSAISCKKEAFDNLVHYNYSYNMSMKSKIRKIGNSYGIVLPKEALARMRAKKGDTLYLIEILSLPVLR